MHCAFSTGVVTQIQTHWSVSGSEARVTRPGVGQWEGEVHTGGEEGGAGGGAGGRGGGGGEQEEEEEEEEED